MFITQTKNTKEKVCVVYRPYDYFDAQLYQYAVEKKSLLFANDMLYNMKTMNADEFLLWLKNIQYIPLINPITANLDKRKNLNSALKTLETYEYIVPFEHLEEFSKQKELSDPVLRLEKSFMPFHISQVSDQALVNFFIEKDMKVYEAAKELYWTIRSSGFSPLPRLSPSLKVKVSYEGIVDNISGNMISGWIFKVQSEESQTVCIYCNGKLLRQVKAEILRPGVKKNKNHPTGLCGFRIHFDKTVFHPSDTIKVITLDDIYILPFGKIPKAFFSS